MIMIKIYKYLLLSGLAFLSISLTAQDEDKPKGEDKESKESVYPDKTPEQIVELQLIIRQRLMLQSEDLVDSGKKLFYKGKYPETIQQFVKAERILKSVGDHKRGKELLVDVQEYLKQTYMAYAHQLIKEAEEQRKSGKFKTAEKYLNDALSYDPALGPIVKLWLKNIEVERLKVEMLNETDPEIVDPEYGKRKLDIQILIERGKVFYQNRRYMRARDEFEKILIMEPGNETSIRYLSFIYKDLREIGRERRSQNQDVYMAEVELKWIDPVPV